jgi:Ca2+-transporting ATPase
VLRLLEVDPTSGLREEEIRARLEKFGLNRLEVRHGTPAWRRLAREFAQPLVYLLLAAAVVAIIVGEWVDAAVIGGVVLVNAVMGFIQESRAERAIESLTRLLTTGATVRRGGRTLRVHSEALVPGDVVMLEAGDRVPADLRLLDVRNLQIDESALTGESLPSPKHASAVELDAVLADRRNLAYAGTLVTAGRAEAVVWATGERTETGRIARLVASAADLSTPLTRKIAEFSRWILWAILGLAVLTFFLGVSRGEPIVDMFMAAVALAVGAIPEGLPAAMTIVLAIGVGRMARRKAIIRKLPAVETLGSTTVICSDKTGTLTENQMTVRELFVAGERFTVTGNGYATHGQIRRDEGVIKPAEHPALLECLRAGLLCNESQLRSDESGRMEVIGDPTEAALLVAAAKGGLVHLSESRASPRIDMLPFESAHMYRATLHHGPERRVIYQVGAAERLLDRCRDTLDPQGRIVPLDRSLVHAALATMAAEGLRVLAAARRHVGHEHTKIDHHHVREGLTFLGLVGMIDPPRREVRPAIRRCRRAGIAVKMITGDHLATAQNVAAQLGLDGVNGGPAEAISGRELEQVPDCDLPQLVERTTVFARVAPEQKFRLVSALQARGHIVAMTGDGVNDAPALKQADIGIAMGVSGTDVARNAAAMVLTDDNFASIEAAVEEGRGVFDNLLKFLVWIIPTNLGESLVLLTAILLGLPLPLLPLQLLWINLTDTLLGLSLAFEPRENNVMRRPPRDPRAPLLAPELVYRTLLVTLIMLAGAFWIYVGALAAEPANLAGARTAVVNLIVVVEAVYLFNCRALTRPIVGPNLLANPWAWAGSGTMLGLQLVFTYAPPMQRWFHTAPMDFVAWLRIGAVAGLIFLLVEFEKWLRHRRAGRRPLLPGPL